MDGKRFDELSKAIATVASRRTVLRGMVAGVVAAAAGAVGLSEAEAGNGRGPGRPCRTNAHCRVGLTCEPPDGRRRVCTCPAGQTTCGGACCDAVCYEDCLSQLCFGTNGTKRVRFNGGISCQEFCAENCSASLPN